MYEIGTCPLGVLFLTIGVDVQKDRLIYEVVGWGRGKCSWSIDAGTLPGDTSDMTDQGPWPRLDALLNRGFPHPNGLELKSALTAVDSGFNTQTVYNWARKYPMSKVIAVKGVDTASVLIGSPSPVDISVNGKKLKRGYKVWPVAGNIAKSELYGFLQLFAPTDEAKATGASQKPGFCTFPQYGEEFFQQLTAEHLVAQRVRGGFTRFAWELIPGRQNHALDCRVYARAAAALVGLDRFRESDWTILEQRLGLSPPPEPEPARAPQPPTTTTTMGAPPPAPRRDPWLGAHRRNGGWLKGRD
jgi:phage terminase large subunit GpA-like protein